MKDHAQEAAIDGQSVFIIVDEAILSEPVHEMTYPRPGRADHLCQGILIYVREYFFSLAFLAKMRKQQESPSQTLLATIEKVVHKILFISDVACQQMLDKQF